MIAQGGVFVAEEVDVCGEIDGAVSITGEARRVCDCCCMVQYIEMSICLYVGVYVVGNFFCNGGGWRDYEAGELELMVGIWSEVLW